MVPLVLHIDTGRYFRGGQRQVLLLTEGLRQEGIRQIVACPEGSALDKKITAIDKISLSKKSLIRKTNLRLLRKAIEEHHLNIIHAHDSEAHTIGRLLKRYYPELKLIVTRRVVFAPSSRLSAFWKYGKKVDGYIAISAAVADSLVQAGVDARQIELIPSGLDLEAIATMVKSAPTISEIIDRYKYIVVTAGALTKEKDFVNAIRTVELVSGQISGVALLILGDGPQAKELRRMIENRHLNNVYLMGHQEPLTPFFRGAHIFLLTSISEGLNSSAIEAAACGLPLIVSKVGGLPEIAEHNFNGILCYPGHPEGYAKAMINLLQDEKKRQEMSLNSLFKARSFDIRETARKTLAYYNRVLGE